MAEAHEVVEKFLLPWLDKNHPHADIVIMAGSFGRAMKEGSYKPMTSSDIDLIIVYTDLEKGGMKAAMQIFKMEDVGTPMGEQNPRQMMIDCNIHDFASLLNHAKFVRDHIHTAFVPVMIDEGYAVRDRLGVAHALQENAKKFLEAGPHPTPQEPWKKEIKNLETYLKEIKEADTTEDKRFLGLLCMRPLVEYTLGLRNYWRSGGNQAYRSFARKFPEDEKRISESFSDLLRRGDSAKVETLLQDYIDEGKKQISARPVEASKIPYPEKDFVSADDLAGMTDLRLKFLTDHWCEALETSQRRGELAYLENMSVTLCFIKLCLETKDGINPVEGREAMRYLSMKAPDIMPVMLQALDEEIYEPVRKIADDALSHVGGRHYALLQNYYPEDVARVNALEEKKAVPAPKKWFQPGFKH